MPTEPGDDAPDLPGRPVVREAEEADLGRIVELFALGAVPGAVPVETAPGRAPYRAAWREIDAGPGCVLVAELGGVVVGACQLIVFRHLQSTGGLCAELESVHVHPDHRGHGIGGELVRQACAIARRLGCYRIQLTSNVARADAHRFYGELGFEASHVGFKLRLDGAPPAPSSRTGAQ